MDKKKIIESQILGQQMQQAEQLLNQLAEGINNLTKIEKQIDEFSKLKEGEELLFPVVKGIFAKARYEKTDKLKVNIGKGVVVEKSFEETKQLIQDRKREIDEQQKQIAQEYEGMLEKIKQIEKEWDAEQKAQQKNKNV